MSRENAESAESSMGTLHNEEGERIELLYDRLAGAYFYAGDGDWSEIEDVVKVGDDIEFRTASCSHESVPRDIRERAYDAHDGTTVIVGGDVSE